MDLGHLILGQENVLDLLKRYLPVTSEIHFHGVRGHQEHLSLSVLPENMVISWLKFLSRASFTGVINLEVFNARDLETSMAILWKAWRHFQSSDSANFSYLTPYQF